MKIEVKITDDAGNVQQYDVSGSLPRDKVIKAFQELKDAINDKGCVGNAQLIGSLVWKYFDEFSKQ
jgi:hypothetical protein